MSLGLANYQLSVGGVVIGPGTNYIVTDLQGLGVTNVRTTDTPASQTDGDYFGVDTRGGHSVSIPITVRGDTPDACMANYDALLKQWRVPAGANTQPLTFKLPGRPELRMDGRPRAFTADMSRVAGRRIVVDADYYCAKAILEGSDQQTAGLTLPSAPSARAYPKTFSRVYGAGVSGTATVTNAGTETAWPVLTIQGPVTNPFIQNLNTGETLTLSIVLASGDVLIIDTYPLAHSVQLNGTASRRSSVKAGSSWPSVPVGSSVFKFGGTPGAGTPAATVAWRDAYLG